MAGVTEKPASLGLRSDEPAAVIMDRMRAFRDSMRPQFTAFHLAHQCHGTRIAHHPSFIDGFHLLDDFDGHLTEAAGVLLMVSVADCVPAYLTRDDGSAFALLHCGWRGTAAGMLEKGIAALSSSACPPGRLSVHLGVAICGRCYEVGPEVIKAVEGRDVASKTMFDLRAALKRRAEAAGVRDVTISEYCTRHDNARFFSYRAGDAHGRQLAYLGKPMTDDG